MGRSPCGGIRASAGGLMLKDLFNFVTREPTCEQTDRQATLKTLPSHNFVWW